MTNINKKSILASVKDPEMKRVTLYLPKELVNQLLIDCERNKVAMSPVVAALIKCFLEDK